MVDIGQGDKTRWAMEPIELYFRPSELLLSEERCGPTIEVWPVATAQVRG